MTPDEIKNNQFLFAIGQLIAGRIKKRISEGRVYPKTFDRGGPPNAHPRVKQNAKGQKGTTLVDKGILLNSIHPFVKGSTIYVGTNVKYARIHHEGGVITPKKAQFLAIPLTADAKERKPRDFKDTFIKYGTIYQKTDDPEKPLALYKLMKSVKIPARRYMLLESYDRLYIIEKVRSFLITIMRNTQRKQ